MFKLQSVRTAARPPFLAAIRMQRNVRPGYPACIRALISPESEAELAIPYVGADRILWGSDFPHIRSIGLDAQLTLYEQLQAFPEEDQAKLIGGNAATLFDRD